MKKTFNLLNQRSKNQVNIYTEQKVLMELWSEIYKANNLTDTRERNNIRYRQATMTAMRTHGNLSLSAIGSIFGKDHATVLNAMKNHKLDVDYDKLYRQIYYAIEKFVKDTLDEYDLRAMKIDDDIKKDMDYHSVVRVYRKHIAELEHENNKLKEEQAALKKRVKFLTEQYSIVNEKYHNVNNKLLIKTGMI